MCSRACPRGWRTLRSGVRSCPLPAASAWAADTPPANPSPKDPAAHAECGGDRPWHQRPIRERSQLDEPHPVRVFVGVGVHEVARHLQREARLAAAAGSRERQEPCRIEGAPDFGHLALAPDEAAPGRWQVVAAVATRATIGTLCGGLVGWDRLIRRR